MDNNNTQDFYVEVIRAMSLDPLLTLGEMIELVKSEEFEYKAFGIDKAVAVATVKRAFAQSPVNNLAKLGTMKYRGDYVEGVTYIEDDVAVNHPWVARANKETTDSPSPVLIGNPYNLYSGTIDSNSILSKQIIIGQRHTLEEDSFIEGFRINTITGNEYTVYAIEDPLGIPQISQVFNITASTTGWIDINTGALATQAGVTLDIAMVISEPDATVVPTDISFNYVKTNNLEVPSEGQIKHSNKEPGVLGVSHIDSNLTDQTAVISAVGIGDKIVLGDITWAVQAIVNQGTYTNFSVAPALQSSLSGVQTVTFNTVQPTPITYAEDVGYWASTPETTGFISTGSYGDATYSTTAYGIDILKQDADRSPDWDFISYNPEFASNLVLLNTVRGEVNDLKDKVTCRVSWKATGTTPIKQQCISDNVPEVITFSHNSVEDPRVIVDTLNGTMEVTEDLRNVDLLLSIQVRRDSSGGTSNWGFFFEVWTGASWIEVADSLRFITFKSVEANDTEHISYPLSLDLISKGTKFRFSQITDSANKGIGIISDLPFVGHPISPGFVLSLTTR